MNWYLEPWKKYAVFSGRATRKEYWIFFLVNFIIGLLAYVPVIKYLVFLYALAALIPNIAVGVRRLHDTNRSGWWLLIALIPFAGAIALIVFFALDSQPGDNKYGPNPKVVPVPSSTTVT